jgi:hypothetical protein
MESYQLDTETNKVTVTGHVTQEEVVKALQKDREDSNFPG